MVPPEIPSVVNQRVWRAGIVVSYMQPAKEMFAVRQCGVLQQEMPGKCVIYARAAAAALFSSPSPL